MSIIINRRRGIVSFSDGSNLFCSSKPRFSEVKLNQRSVIQRVPFPSFICVVGLVAELRLAVTVILSLSGIFYYIKGREGELTAWKFSQEA